MDGNASCNQSFCSFSISSDFSDVDSTSFLGVATSAYGPGAPEDDDDQHHQQQEKHKRLPSSIHVTTTSSRSGANNNRHDLDILLNDSVPTTSSCTSKQHKEVHDKAKNDSVGQKSHNVVYSKVDATMVTKSIPNRSSSWSSSTTRTRTRRMEASKKEGPTEAEQKESIHHVIINEDVTCSSSNKRMRERRGNGMFAIDVFTMINRLSLDQPHIARWLEDGDKFVIMDKERFTELFYESGFTTGKSFQYIKKQLGNFGFELQNRYLDSKEKKNRYVYCHPVVRRGAEIDQVREVLSLRSAPRKKSRRLPNIREPQTRDIKVQGTKDPLSDHKDKIFEALDKLSDEIVKTKEVIETELGSIKSLLSNFTQNQI